MIKTYEIELDSNLISYQSGSSFQGVLMQGVSTEFAKFVHSLDSNPYSQYLYKRDGKWVWRISSLSNYACAEIDNFIFDISNKRSIYLENKQISININSVQILEETSFEELITKTYSNEIYKSSFDIEFVTPTSFKSGGAYQIFPSSSLIMQSLITKFNSNSQTMKITDEQVVSSICSAVTITSYKLKSMIFHLEKTKIPSFMGSVKLKVEGPRQLKELVGLLISIAQYTGVGMKTSIGMGGVKDLRK